MTIKSKNLKKSLKNSKTNVETKGNYGRTPLNNPSANCHLDVVKYLYETCHANAETKNSFGWTPINLASVKGHVDVVKYLSKIGHADVETKSK